MLRNIAEKSDFGKEYSNCLIILTKNNSHSEHSMIELVQRLRELLVYGRIKLGDDIDDLRLYL